MQTSVECSFVTYISFIRKNFVHVYNEIRSHSHFPHPAPSTSPKTRFSQLQVCCHCCCPLLPFLLFLFRFVSSPYGWRARGKLAVTTPLEESGLTSHISYQLHFSKSPELEIAISPINVKTLAVLILSQGSQLL